MADTKWLRDTHNNVYAMKLSRGYFTYYIQATSNGQVFVSFYENIYNDYDLPLNWVIT